MLPVFSKILSLSCDFPASGPLLLLQHVLQGATPLGLHLFQGYCVIFKGEVIVQTHGIMCRACGGVQVVKAFVEHVLGTPQWVAVSLLCMTSALIFLVSLRTLSLTEILTFLFADS